MTTSLRLNLVDNDTDKVVYQWLIVQNESYTDTFIQMENVVAILEDEGFPVKIVGMSKISGG